MTDHAISDQAAPPPDGDDEQIAAANSFARDAGGAEVEPPAEPTGSKPPPPPAPIAPADELRAGVGTRATDPAVLEALYVRLPGVGWGEHRFFAEIGLRLRDKNIFRIGRDVIVVDDDRIVCVAIEVFVTR